MEVGTLVARWRSAEAKLYPTVMVDPQRYEASLELVRSVSDALESCGSIEELVAAYDRRDELLRGALDRTGGPAPSAEVAAIVVDAAFANRHRRLHGLRQQAEATRRIAAAGGTEGWVTLAQSGEEAAARPGFDRIEMRLPDGLGLHTYVDTDATTYLPEYGIELLALDPSTGEVSETGSRPERQVFGDASTWRRRIAEVKSASA